MKKLEFLVILSFILSVLGLLLTSYYLFIAEKINNKIFVGSTIVKIVVIIFLIWYLINHARLKQ